MPLYSNFFTKVKNLKIFYKEMKSKADKYIKKQTKQSVNTSTDGRSGQYEN